MKRLECKLAFVLSVSLVVVCAAGCLTSRGAIQSEVAASRYRSYARWRGDEGAEALLPRVDGDLNLEAAVKLGLRYNPGLQEILQEKERARGQLYTAYSEGLPRVDLNAGYTRLDEQQVVDLGFTTFPVGDQDNWNYGFTVTQPLFKGGSIPAVIRGARYFQFLSDETVRQGVQDVILIVANAYYDVLLAQRLLEVQEQALELAKANLDDVTARKEAGVAIEYDRLRARVEVSNVEADMIQQRNVLNRSWTTLFRAMGVSQKSEVELIDELAYMPIEPDFQRAVEIAFTNRPELFQAELDVRVQETVLRTFYSDYLPVLEGWFNQRWAKPGPKGEDGWGDEWSGGVRLTWALFDGLLREGNIIQQKALLEQSAIRLADTEQQVLEDVKNAIFDLADAEELVKSQELNLETAEEALRLVQIGAKEGVNTELEVLDARSALTRTVGLYYNSLYAHTVSRLRLQRALGMLGPPPGTRTVPQDDLPQPSVVPEFMTADAEERPARDMDDLPPEDEPAAGEAAEEAGEAAEEAGSQAEPEEAAPADADAGAAEPGEGAVAD